MCHGQMISQALVNARKIHKCDCCGKHVERGMKYVRTVATVDGDFQSSKLCTRCQALLEFYYDEGDIDACFDLAELRGYVNEMIQDDKSLWGKLRSKLRSWTHPRGDWHT